MLNNQEEIIQKYRVETSGLQDQLANIKKQIDRFSFIRIILFVAEVFVFISFVRDSEKTSIYLGSLFLLIPVVLFIWVVRKQALLDQNAAYFRQLLWVYENEINMLSGIENGYNHGKIFESDEHPYSADLDVYGHASIYAMVNRCSSGDGQLNLANILSGSRNYDQILERQSAIQEIEEDIHRTFSFRANLRNHNENKIQQIKQKLKGKLAGQLEFTHHTVLRSYLSVVPFITVGLVIAGILVHALFFKALVFLGICHAACTFYYMKQINLLYSGFSGSAALLNDCAKAIVWTEDKDWLSPYLRRLFQSDEKVSLQIKKLSAIIQAFDARLNVVVSTILNLFLLWDLRCCVRLDNWYHSSVSGIEDGLNRIGEFEELISFATLNYNHPDWSLPKIQEEFYLDALAIGHPLIRKDKRIVNDFKLSGKPTVDVITGSNMAGKSTFLRTLGLNMILAYAGTKVCAKYMSLSVFKLLTYMRIKDSLNESTSTFKAELNRLKMILREVSGQPDPFVLIDEMLRGTNSRDKYLGSKVFIEKLIKEQTPGLFATHDLQLSELIEQYPEQLRNFHFDIQIDAAQMHFDYKIKNGPCKTFNAAILLKEIGLVLNDPVY